MEESVAREVIHCLKSNEGDEAPANFNDGGVFSRHGTSQTARRTKIVPANEGIGGEASEFFFYLSKQKNDCRCVGTDLCRGCCNCFQLLSFAHSTATPSFFFFGAAVPNISSGGDDG